MADSSPKRTDNAILGKLLIAEKDFVQKMESLGRPDDYSREIVNIGWRGRLRDCYFDGRESSEPADAVDAAVWERFQAWAVGSRLDDLESLLIVREDGEPLAGGPGEASLAARRLARETGFRRSSIGALIEYSLAPTLKRWERTKTATPEEQADFLLPALGIGDAPQPLPVLAEFGARLWHALQGQSERDIDYWKTVRAHGDFFVRAKGRETQALAAVAYQALIGALQPSAGEREAADLIRGAANNLASLLDNLGGKSPGPGVVRGIAAAAFVHVLASDALDARAAMASAERRALALDDMANVPAAFQQIGEDSPQVRFLRQAWFSARAGAVRARLRKPGQAEAKDVAAAFFNAGVALLRGGYRGQAPAVAARIVVNGLGLWWALQLAANDEALALGAYNGGDCAVNLMGVLTDLGESKRANLDLPELWSALASRRNLLGEDFSRVEASAIEMKLVGHGGQGNEPLLAAVSRFLAAVGGELDIPTLPRLVQLADVAEPRRAACLSWRSAARALQALAEGRTYSLCLPMWRALNRKAPGLPGLPDAIHAYWTAYVGEQDVLVVSGLMRAEDILTLLDHDAGGADSLGNWLEKSAWDLAGALARR